MLSISKLRNLEDERFYSLLDVALDIRGELDFGVQRMEVPLMRHLVRFGILLPASTPSMMDRYCDLRWKALKFFEAEGYLSDVENIDTFNITHWDNRVGLNVLDAATFYEAAVMLSEEEERREPNNLASQDVPSAMVRIEQLCNSFHAVALKLQFRHGQRPGLKIDDEYDVQDVLGSLLETRFTDVRPEEWTPSHAGKSARMDFLLKQENVVVETKMTRDGLTDKKIGDELILDIDRYKANPNCKALFCFVYDPDHRLKNPAGLEGDLSRKTDGLLVRVRVRPKR
jgi:hypothetical protein